MLLGSVTALLGVYSTIFEQDFNVSAPPTGWSIQGYNGSSHTSTGTAKTNANLFKNDGGDNYLRLTEDAGYNRAWAYYNAGKFDVMGKWKLTAEVRIGKTHNGDEITNGADGLCFVFLDASTVETLGELDMSKVEGGYGEFEGAPRGGLPNTPVNGAKGYHDGLRGFSCEFDHYNNSGELFREYIHWVDLNDWQHSGLGLNLDTDTGFYYNDGWERVQLEADAGIITFSYNWGGSSYANSFQMDTLNPPNTNCDDLYSFDAYFGICGATGGQTAYHEVRLLKMETDEEVLPLEMSSFSAIATNDNYAALQWVTYAETNMSGFRIYRGTNDTFEASIDLNVFIDAANSSQTTTYRFVDSEIDEIGSYYYWLQSEDLGGATNLFGPVNVVISDPPTTTPDIPVTQGISNVYPNPFNPNTTVKFGILSPNHTTIEIYNTRGQIIRTLTNQHYLPGEYTVTWDGKDNLGKACSSGVYSMQMVSGKTVSSRKLVLMK
jgi:hypothetical protein